MADNEQKISILYTLKDQASKGIGTIENAMGSLSKVVTGLAVAGIGLLVAGLYKSVQAFGESEQAISRLDQALKNGGYTTDRASKQLQAYASELQKVTVFSDETIMSAEAVYAQYGYTIEQTKQLTKATLDFASAKGIDAKSASELIAKSIETGTAIRGVGIEINGTKGSADRINNTIGALAGTFGGQATAQANTMNGAMSRLKNQFDDFLEVVGSKLSPVITGLVNGLSTGITWLNKFAQSFKMPEQSEASKILAYYAQQVKDGKMNETAYAEAVALVAKELETKNAQMDLAIQKENEKIAIEQENNRIRGEMQDTFNAQQDQKEIDRAIEQFNRMASDEQAKIDLTKMTYDQLAKLKAKSDAQNAKIEQQKMQGYKDSLSFMASGLQSNNATIFAIGKASAVANATISTYEAFNKTLSAYPFPFNIAMAGATLAVGLDNVSRINATQMQLAEGGTFTADQTTPFNIGGQQGVFGEAGAEQVRFEPLNGGGGSSIINVSIDGRAMAKHLYTITKELERSGEVDTGR